MGYDRYSRRAAVELPPDGTDVQPEILSNGRVCNMLWQGVCVDIGQMQTLLPMKRIIVWMAAAAVVVSAVAVTAQQQSKSQRAQTKSQRTEVREQRHEERVKRRAERLAACEKHMDSIILSRNFQFNPSEYAASAGGSRAPVDRIPISRSGSGTARWTSAFPTSRAMFLPITTRCSTTCFRQSRGTVPRTDQRRLEDRDLLHHALLGQRLHLHLRHLLVVNAFPPFRRSGTIPYSTPALLRRCIDPSAF